ncbi:hypothetical protein D3C80_1155620 [compost metagenome]
MHDPAEVCTVFRFDRNDKAVTPDRHKLILKHLGHGGRPDHGIQLLADPGLSAAQFPADRSQLRTGRIEHISVLINTCADGVLYMLLF